MQMERIVPSSEMQYLGKPGIRRNPSGTVESFSGMAWTSIVQVMLRSRYAVSAAAGFVYVMQYSIKLASRQ